MDFRISQGNAAAVNPLGNERVGEVVGQRTPTTQLRNQRQTLLDQGRATGPANVSQRLSGVGQTCTVNAADREYMRSVCSFLNVFGSHPDSRLRNFAAAFEEKIHSPGSAVTHADLMGMLDDIFLDEHAPDNKTSGDNSLSLAYNQAATALVRMNGAAGHRGLIPAGLDSLLETYRTAERERRPSGAAELIGRTARPTRTETVYLNYWDAKMAQRVLRAGTISRADLNALFAQHHLQSLDVHLSATGEFPRIGGLNHVPVFSLMTDFVNFSAHDEVLDVLRPYLPERPMNSRELKYAVGILTHQRHTLQELDVASANARLQHASDFLNADGTLKPAGKKILDKEKYLDPAERIGKFAATAVLAGTGGIAYPITNALHFKMDKRRTDPERWANELLRQL